MFDSHPPSISPSLTPVRIVASVNVIFSSVPGLIAGTTKDFFEKVTYSIFVKELEKAEPESVIEQISIQSQSLLKPKNDTLTYNDNSFNESLIVKVYTSVLSQSMSQLDLQWRLGEFLISTTYKNELQIHSFFKLCAIVLASTSQYDSSVILRQNEIKITAKVADFIIFAILSCALASISFVAGLNFRGKSQKDVKRKRSDEEEGNRKQESFPKWSEHTFPSLGNNKDMEWKDNLVLRSTKSSLTAGTSCGICDELNMECDLKYSFDRNLNSFVDVKNSRNGKYIEKLEKSSNDKTLRVHSKRSVRANILQDTTNHEKRSM